MIQNKNCLVNSSICILLEKIDARKNPIKHYYRCPIMDPSRLSQGEIRGKAKGIDFVIKRKECPDASCKYHSGEYVFDREGL
ncbi:hypothetical protein HZA33_01885 [Candidatus Pacearchaeota archaeon]|nr:hypothetical protein [Candidatus Pacearchaeota archaeon]